MAIVYKAYAIEGLSTDSKPTLVPTGRKFYETDTERWYDFNGSTWDVLTGIAIPHSTTIGDYSQPNAGGISSVDASNSDSSITVTQSDNDSEYNLYSGSNTRLGIKINAGSALIGKTVLGVDFLLRKTGSPTGSIICNVRNSSDTIKSEIGTFNPSSLNYTDVYRTFTGSGSATLEAGDYITCEYPSGNGSNTVIIRYQNSDVYDSTNTTQALYNGSWSEETAKDVTFKLRTVAGAIVDDSTGTKATTTAEANPSMYVDCGGSSINLTGIAIYLNALTTETEIKIQTSPDATTWTDKRTITVSNLTTGSWNYIRFNTTNARYIRVYGSSGSSTILSIDEIKYLTKTDAELISDHQHVNIDSSSTGLPLGG